MARLLVGAGAVVVAVLVLIALFRPDGPLDPPSERVGNEGAKPTGAPLLAPAAPTALTPAPAPAVEGTPGDDDPAAVRHTGSLRPDAPDDRPTDDATAAPGDVAHDVPVGVPADGGRAVDTTPPTAPTSRNAAPRSGLGAAPRTPPTPAAPPARA